MLVTRCPEGWGAESEQSPMLARRQTFMTAGPEGVEA
jgi:hypothetical protein